MSKRITRASLANIGSRTLNLGYVGENEHTQIVIDCTEVFWDYPDADFSAVVQAPTGANDLYNVVLQKDGYNLIWDVSASDVVYAGSGQIQLTFSNDGEIIRSAIGGTTVASSLEATGEAPTPIQNWMDEAEETARQIAEDAAEGVVDDLADAKDEAIAAIEAKGEEVIEEIPSDYTQLSSDVTELKSAFTSLDGGTTGQVLRKKSSTDMDVEWASVAQPTNEQVADAVSDWLNDHPEAVTTVDFSIVAKVFPTVADMASDLTLESGDNVATRGYYASGDNGGANYVVSSTHTGVFYITLDNGLYANMLSESGLLPAESIGIKSYATSQENPDSDAMGRNVTLFNAAVYNGIYLLFGKGHYYFSDAVQLAHKSTYTIRGLAREVTHLIFPSSDGFYFSDPIYYNYYVIKGMHIKAYGNTIGCAPHCLTILDSHFEWLQLESETGNCFDAPTYNVAKYTSQGGSTVYDTCVQNCVFDFINASAPLGAAFCNIMGMYTYYMHMNFVSCKYAFRNCDGIVKQTNTLGTNEDYFIYYDKANSHSLRWEFENVNAESIAKAFIYTEPQVNVPSGEDARKPETANIMTIERITAINSGWSLKSGTSNHDVYPITVHEINSIWLMNSDRIVIPNAYPNSYDTDTVKAHIMCRRSQVLNYYNGGPDIIMIQGTTTQRRFGTNGRRIGINNGNNGGYNTLVNRNTPVYTELLAKMIYGGKNLDVWETKSSVTTTATPSPDFEKSFCDVIVFEVDTASDKIISSLAANYESNYPGRIIELVNKKTSLHNLILQSVNARKSSGNYSLSKECYYSVVLAPGEHVKLIATYETNPVNGNWVTVWKPLDPKYISENQNIDLLYESLRMLHADKVLEITAEGHYIPNNIATIDMTDVRDSTIQSGTYKMRYILTPCTEGDQFTIYNGHGAGNACRLWSFVGSTGSRLTYAGENVFADGTVITAPANAAYLIVNSYKKPIVFKSN